MMSANNYQRDGFMALNNQGGAPNYYPNSFSGPQECPAVKAPAFPVSGDVDRYDPVNEDDFGQVTSFYRDVLDDAAKARFADNLVNHMKGASAFIVERAVKNFAQVDLDLGRRLTEGLRKAGVKINVSGVSGKL